MGSSACACAVVTGMLRDAVGSSAMSSLETWAKSSSSLGSVASTRGAGTRGVDVSVPCAGGNRERTARESSRLRLGGYAALSRDDQSLRRFWPPTCVGWVECVQLRAARCDRLAAMGGLHRSVVYFWAGAPSAHCGKVMGNEE
eukprot:6199718-Pleurochrysis_carterae.AAC.1